MSDRGTRDVLVVDPFRSGHVLLETAARMGLNPVPVYTVPDAWITAYADPSQVSTEAIRSRDARAVVSEVARRGLRVAGVVAALEPGVQLADEVADQLGLPGNAVRTAATRRSKIAMRRHGAERDVPQPRFRVARKAAVPAAAAELGFPVIVKSPTGAAAHNIILVTGSADLARVDEARDEDIFGGTITEWLVEEYVRGPEYAVNTFSFGDDHVVLDISEYLRPDDRDHDQPYWDICHLARGTAVADELAEFAGAVLRAYEVTNGPSHIECKLTQAGPVFLEIGARLPGNTPDAWVRHSRVDPFRATVEARLGTRPEIMDKGLALGCYLGETYIVNDGPPGRLVELSGLDDVARLPGVDIVHPNFQVGDDVPMTRDLATDLVTILVSGHDVAAVRAVQRAVRRAIRVHIEATS